MKHIHLNTLISLCIFAGLTFTACNLSDAKEAATSASSALSSSGSAVTEPGESSATSSSSAAEVKCLAEFSESTENYLAVWDSCRALYERVIDSSLNLACIDIESEDHLCPRDTTSGQLNEIESLFNVKAYLCDVMTDTSENCERLLKARFDTETGMLKSANFGFVNKMPYLAVDGNYDHEITNVYFRTLPSPFLQAKVVPSESGK